MIPPFGDGSQPHRTALLLNSVLSRCRFMPFSGGRFLESDTYYLLAEEAELDIDPVFEFRLSEIDALAESLRASRSDLSLVVSMRNGLLRRYRPLGRWRLNEDVPEAWSPDQDSMRGLQSKTTVGFILGVQVSSDTAELNSSGLSFGKVLCRKEFTVRAPQDDGTDFPFQWTDFPSIGYPPELLWAIQWLNGAEGEGDNTLSSGENPYKRPVRDVLVVHGNAAAERTLTQMPGGGGGLYNLVWRSIAAEITTDIWEAVIRGCSKDLPDRDDIDTLAGQVFNRVSDLLGLDYAEIHDHLFGDADIDKTELRKAVSRIIRVVT